MLPYATLALGSALAAFMYPHTLTGIFASKSADTIRKNAILLPAYTLLLGLIALLGYMAHAANIKVTSNNDVVPMLFKVLFPSWFAGFAFSAIAIGALVPAGGDEHRRRQSVHPQCLEILRQIPASAMPARRRSPRSRRWSSSSARLPSSSSCRRNTRSTCNCSAAAGSCKPSRRWCSDYSRAGSAPRACCSAGPPGIALGIVDGVEQRAEAAREPIDLGGVSYAFYVGLGALVLNVIVAIIASRSFVSRVSPSR